MPRDDRTRFPAPADDYIEGRIDLNKHLVKNPATTFLVRVAGESMIDDGFHPGDLIIVDRSVDMTDGCTAIVGLDGDFTVKRIRKKGRPLWLVSNNKDDRPPQIKEDQGFEVWGVATYVIHAL